MRRGVLLLPFLTALLHLGCGGSSSETPWPREPEGPTLGPAGESVPLDAPEDAPADAPASPEEGEGDEEQDEGAAMPVAPR